MSDYNDDVINQLAAIRDGGYCNMFNKGCVEQAAQQIGFEELSEFLTDADATAYIDHLEEMGRRQ